MPKYAKTLLALILLVFSTQASAQVYKNWGLVFPTSQSGEAQEHFLDAVTYMHLHMFEDAEEQFRMAQRLVPDFAMAYWGEALLQTGDAAAALAQFQQGLTRYRGRTNLLLGAARAANSMGREDLAQHYYSQLAEIWQRADSRHPFTAEVGAKIQR